MMSANNAAGIVGKFGTANYTSLSRFSLLSPLYFCILTLFVLSGIMVALVKQESYHLAPLPSFSSQGTLPLCVKRLLRRRMRMRRKMLG